VADVRHCFSKHGGNLGVSGSVAFLFDRKGLISFAADNDFDSIFEIALEAGAEDVRDEGDVYEVITDPASFIEVRDAMTNAGLQWETAEIAMLPQTQVQLSGKPAETMLKLMDALEDNDDVQNVYANFDISEDELAKII
jgi:transcriptional/translational regulatory protein YebC/TACO1